MPDLPTQKNDVPLGQDGSQGPSANISPPAAPLSPARDNQGAMHATQPADLGVGAIYRHHHAFVRNCLRRFRLQEDDLDDAVQDVFTAMLGRAGEQLDRTRSVRPWLFGISRNLAFNAHRRAARRSRLLAHAPPAPAVTTPHDHVERREATHILEQFLDRLDPDKLAPFVLLDIEGLPARHVAERLGLPVTTVRWRARAARAELERLAGERSRSRLSSLVVWLWPWPSARVGPWLTWLVAAGLLLAWLAAPERASRPAAHAPTHVDEVASTGSVPGSRREPPPRPQLPAMLALDPQAATIAGRVLDQDGHPIVDALVCHTIEATARARIEDIEPGCTNTDALGRYHLEGVRPGPHRIDASAPGFLPADHGGPHGTGQLLIAAATRHAGIDIVLRRGGARVEGTVVDETGGVVPGALVRRIGHNRFDRSAAAIADDEGRFALWVQQGGVGLEATAEGYSAAQAYASAPQADVELRLMPEVVLAGRVVDRAGAPVADIRVRANPESHNSSELLTFTTTDSEGRFELHRLGPGRYRPTAEGSTAFGQAEAMITLAFGEPVPELVIVTGPAATVHVQIDAAPALAGCEGDWLEGFTEAHRFATRITESRGTLRGIPPGPLSLVTFCRGQQAEAMLEVTGVDTLEATVHVRASATVEGRAILGEDGLGAFMRVKLIPAGTVIDGPMLPEGTVMTETNAEGHFVVALASAGSYQAIGSTGSGASLPLRSFTAEDGEHVDLGALPLPALGHIEGRVTDPDGKGVGGLRVSARERPGVEGLTRLDGTFSLLELVPGDYVLGVTQSVVPLDDTALRVTVAADETASVVLPVPRLDGVLAGVVVDSEGEPVPDAKVAIATLRGAPATERLFRIVAEVQADDEGRFSRAELLPGAYELEVSALVGEGTSPDRPGCKGETRTDVKAGGGTAVVVSCR